MSLCLIDLDLAFLPIPENLQRSLGTHRSHLAAEIARRPDISSGDRGNHITGFQSGLLGSRALIHRCDQDAAVAEHAEEIAELIGELLHANAGLDV